MPEHAPPGHDRDRLIAAGVVVKFRHAQPTSQQDFEAAWALIQADLERAFTARIRQQYSNPHLVQELLEEIIQDMALRAANGTLLRAWDPTFGVGPVGWIMGHAQSVRGRITRAFSVVTHRYKEKQSGDDEDEDENPDPQGVLQPQRQVDPERRESCTALLKRLQTQTLTLAPWTGEPTAPLLIAGLQLWKRLDWATEPARDLMAVLPTFVAGIRDGGLWTARLAELIQQGLDAIDRELAALEPDGEGHTQIQYYTWISRMTRLQARRLVQPLTSTVLHRITGEQNGINTVEQWNSRYKQAIGALITELAAIQTALNQMDPAPELHHD
ncbi:MAG: hypothetical protein RLZZ127_510 [Planctomycetota bacterium]|jgi:hypothetical protein